MLGKLLKYDLKPIFKPLVLFYIIMFLAAVIGRLSENFGNSAILHFIHEFCSGSILGFAIGAILNNILNLWRLFHSDIYKDHSYLIHTLPISITKIYFSKFLTAAITTFTTLAVMAISLFVAYATPELLEHFHIVFQTIPYSLLIVILTACTIYLEVIFAAQVGITSIVIGNRANSNRTLLSIITGFVIYGISNTLTILIVFVIGLFNPNIMQIFTDDLHVFAQPNGLDIFLQIMSICALIYILLITTIYFIGQKLLTKGINVD